jgi:hypothetical protein
MFESFEHTHYIAHIFQAVRDWLENNPEWKGTSVWLQMEDIKNQAEKEFKARYGIGEKGCQSNLEK